MSNKVYEDAKEDLNGVRTPQNFSDQFSQKVSLRRANQTEPVQHRNHLAATEFVPKPLRNFLLSSLDVIQLDL